MRFAYADPPYFRMGKRLYGSLHEEASKWDSKEAHIELVETLCSDYPDGWALSCNPKDLSWILPHVPEECRVAVWTKTFHQIRPTSTQYAWEPVIWHTTKKAPKRPMVRDWISGSATRLKGTPGAKPHFFNRWILDLLIYDPEEDTLEDLFPGSNGMAMALSERRLA